ncbi:MAG TPA: chloride channel protein [Steroidobacteraceae bacterium]|nr:chloride channel protein [Steroidobacteraceae bacterium]
MSSSNVASHTGLGDFRVTPRVLSMILMGVVTGALGVGAAWILLKLIALATNVAWYGRWSFAGTTIAGTHVGAWGILIPAIGGLVIGLMARFGTEKIRGHGIPEAIEAILMGGSRIQPKVAVLKPLSSAISIGTGGPFGAEGPIIMTGGALGSLFAQLFHLTSAERKTLLVAGAAAGMTGVFGTPVAAILLAIELLLFEWRPRSFLPVAMSAVVAAVLRTWVFPSGPLFPFSEHIAISAPALLTWLGIGVIAGLGSAVLTAIVYGTEDAFAKLPIHWMWWPAIGGVLVGIGGWFQPAALGVGYDLIQAMLNQQFTLTAIVVLVLVKALVWGVALGSGTSGGVLAPLLIIGGALGTIAGAFVDPSHVALCALLGMAAMMGGTMRSPLTASIFAVELTGNFEALLPLMAACSAAHAVTVLLLKRSILTERIARRGHHISREYSIDPFETTRVKDVMVTSVDTLPANMQIADVIEFFTTGEHRHKSYPVVDEREHCIGMVSRADVLRWTKSSDQDNTLADGVGERDMIHGRPDELVGSLADRMTNADVGRVPILDEHGKLVGLIARKDLLRARARLIPHEHERTAPLLARVLRSG